MTAGDRVILAAGGRRQSVRAGVIGTQEFAGYWEYLLEEAIFTAPAHPLWGGAGLIGRDGRLLGIGSLNVQQVVERDSPRDINMVVPIDILKRILDELPGCNPRVLVENIAARLRGYEIDPFGAWLS